MNKNMSLSLVLVITLFAQINALPALNEDCLEKLNNQLAGLPVPPEVEKLVGYVRSLNPALKDESINKVLEDKRAELDLYNAGFIKEGEDDLIVVACADYIRSVTETMRATACGEELIEMSENSQQQFDTILESNAGLDKVYGYGRVCIRLLQ